MLIVVDGIPGMRTLQTIRDAVDLSSAQSTEKVTEVMEQKHTREFPAGNDAETSAGRVKLGKKKRKRLEEEILKETTSSVAVTTEATASDAHSRVWRYVCNRAVLVNSKYIRDSGESYADQPIESAQPAYGKGTVVTEIQVAGKKIVVTNTKKGAVAQEWLNRQKGTVFGLDAEWRPSYKKGTEHKVALLQVWLR